jgi:hypothetical protein
MFIIEIAIFQNKAVRYFMRRFFCASVYIFEIDEFVILCIVSVAVITNGIQNILCLPNVQEQDNNINRIYQEICMLAIFLTRTS